MSEIERPWTAGPWLVEQLTVYSLTDEISPENRWWAGLQTQHDNASRAELVANAKLISAAPDLAEALHSLLIALDGDKSRSRDYYHERKAARTALRKAGMEGV